MSVPADETLSAAGFRPTRQRRAVFETLKTMTSHPTTEEVFASVRPGLPHISLATVYKALESLVAAGLARKLICCDSSARYDARTDAHYHARCRTCGVVFDVEPMARFTDALKQLSIPLAVLDRVRLEFHGVCEDCHQVGAGVHARHAGSH